MSRTSLWLLSSIVLAGCAASTQTTQTAPATSNGAAKASLSWERAQYPSTYRRRPYPPVLIRNATLMTGVGAEITGASILFSDGRIVAVGTDLQPPPDATVVDGTGKFVTPGLI
ncbi:MAG: amidohydrolase, partial [Gemmatimonadota bacterium]